MPISSVQNYRSTQLPTDDPGWKTFVGTVWEWKIKNSCDKNKLGKCNKFDTTEAGNDSWFVRTMTTSRLGKLMAGMIHLIRLGKIMKSVESSKMAAW